MPVNVFVPLNAKNISSKEDIDVSGNLFVTGTTSLKDLNVLGNLTINERSIYNLESPNFTGVPKINDVNISTSSDLEFKADLASPSFTGVPTAPTALAETNTTQIATTEFVNTAVNNLVGSAPGILNTLGEIAEYITDTSSDVAFVLTTLNNKANVESPGFTGIVDVSGNLRVNGAIFGNSAGIVDVSGSLTVRGQNVATTSQLALKANLASPVFTGQVTLGSDGLIIPPLYGSNYIMNVQDNPQQSGFNDMLVFSKNNKRLLTISDFADTPNTTTEFNGNVIVDGDLTVNDVTATYGGVSRTDDWNIQSIVQNIYNLDGDNQDPDLQSLKNVASYVRDISNNVGKKADIDSPNFTGLPKINNDNIVTSSQLALKANLDGADFTGPVAFNGSVKIRSRLDISGETVITGKTNISGNTSLGGNTFIHDNFVISENQYIDKELYINGGLVIGDKNSDNGVYMISYGNELNIYQRDYTLISNSSNFTANNVINEVSVNVNGRLKSNGLDVSGGSISFFYEGNKYDITPQMLKNTFFP